MVTIHHKGHCAAPVAVTFAYLDDYRNATEWMFGLTAFEPAGERAQGLGAVLAGTFHVKPVTLHSTIEITEWEKDRLIAFTSIDGFSVESRWQFHAIDDEQTMVHIDFHYEMPGGLAGRALGRVMEPIVALSVRHSDHALRKHVEQRYSGAGR